MTTSIDICKKCMRYNYYPLINTINDNNDCNKILNILLSKYVNKSKEHKCFIIVLSYIINHKCFDHIYNIVLFNNLAKSMYKNKFLMTNLCLIIARHINNVYVFLCDFAISANHGFLGLSLFYGHDYNDISNTFIVSHILARKLAYISTSSINIITNELDKYKNIIDLEYIYKIFVTCKNSYISKYKDLHLYFYNNKVDISKYIHILIDTIMINKATCSFMFDININYSDEVLNIINKYMTKNLYDAYHRDFIAYNLCYHLPIKNTFDVNTVIQLNYSLLCLWEYNLLSNAKMSSTVTCTVGDFTTKYRKILYKYAKHCICLSRVDNGVCDFIIYNIGWVSSLTGIFNKKLHFNFNNFIDFLIDNHAKLVK